MCPPGRLCWGSDWSPALFWGNNEQRGGMQPYPPGRPILSLSQPPSLPPFTLNLRFIQTAPSPSGPTQRGAERGSSGWLQNERSGLASFVPDLCAC